MDGSFIDWPTSLRGPAVHPFRGMAERLLWSELPSRVRLVRMYPAPSMVHSRERFAVESGTRSIWRLEWPTVGPGLALAAMSQSAFHGTCPLVPVFRAVQFRAFTGCSGVPE